MQKQIIVEKDIIRSIKYICPACLIEETDQDCDISGSKFSAWSELDVLKEV
tara:strand:+ start:4107 stop:4259 length:153 start_codon:yes stop_codon:yes gene_type:complete